MTALAYSWATAWVLWRRDWLRFWRQPSRIVGALGQPVIFWAMIGTGMTASFALPTSSMPYTQFFFPGVVVMVVLFASIFSASSLIEDRHHGFLQSVMVAPGSHRGLVLGKCLGAATMGLVQAFLLLLLAPLAGFGYAEMAWLPLVGALAALALGLSALGFFVAWVLDSTQGYHAVQMTLLVPLWIISGAMFPASAEFPALALAMYFNPLSYGVTAVRHAMHGGVAPEDVVVMASGLQQATVLAVFAVGALLLAMRACGRGR